MSSLRTIVTFSSLMLAFCRPVAAQTLSLHDCVRLALQRNPRLVSAGNLKQGAEQKVREAVAARRLRLNLAAGASFAPVTGLDPALTEGGEYEGLIEVKQPLFEGTIKPAQQQSRVELQQASHVQTRVAADLRLEVRLAYIDLLRAQRQNALTEQSLADLQSYLATVRALAYGGAVPQTDITRAEIQVQTETIARNDLRTGMEVAMQQLLEAVGLPLDTTIVVAGEVTLPVPPERFGNNLDLQENAYGLELAKLDVKLAQAARAPALTAFGSAGGWTSRNQLLEKGTPHLFGVLAGVSLEVPLWNGGALAARLAQKNAALAAQQADFEVLHRRLATAYQICQQQYHAAAERLQLLQSSHAKAAEQYDILLAQYAGGGVSNLEVIDAHRTLLEFALQQEQTRAEIDMLQAQMLRLTGEQE